MKTIESFAPGLPALPLRTSWYLAELPEAKSKQELSAKQAVDGMASGFTLRELEAACPGISRDMVRRVLRQMQQNAQPELCTSSTTDYTDTTDMFGHELLTATGSGSHRPGQPWASCPAMGGAILSLSTPFHPCSSVRSVVHE
ncbi:MAG: hypothetical protein JXR77_03735 [Lentisphaeria bacterium]|nr:hypothetical protein [Lentisphaeria bacterium]